MDEKTEPQTEQAEEKPAPVITFLLKSAVRDRTNRTARVVNALGRVPFVQRIAGGTIIVRRARPARISEAALLANIEEISKLVAQHRLIVTTMDGRVVSLETLQGAPKAPASPLPNPPLDSAKNDQNENVGNDMPPSPEGTTLNAPEPELLKALIPKEPEADKPEPEPTAEVPADPAGEPVDSQALLDETKKSHKKGKRG